MFDASINYKTGGSIVNTSGYIAQGYDKSGTGAGSTLSLKIADGNSVKAINLDFVGSPATYTYTFPATSGTVALTSDLSAYVTLATAQTISGAKTFSLDINVNGINVGKGGGSGLTYNTRVGALSFMSNTTGAYNSSFGYESLNANTTGLSNTAIGFSALSINTTGNYNTSIGAATMQLNTTGYNNTAVGYGALTSSLGSYNVAVGSNALGNNTTGYNNTAIGQQAGSQITTGANNTIIGAFIGSPTMSNNIVLADGAGNIRYQWNGTNNVFGNPISGTSAVFSNSLEASVLQSTSGIILSTTIQVTPSSPSIAICGTPTGLEYRTATNVNSLVFQAANYTYTFPAATGTLALTSNLSAYLPLAGGTLTGALGGTSATFTFPVTAASFVAKGSTSTVEFMNSVDTTLKHIIFAESYSATVPANNVLKFQVANQQNGVATPLTLYGTGAATFSSSVTSSTSTNANFVATTSSASGYSYIDFINTGASGKSYEIGVGGNSAASGYANNLYFDLVGTGTIMTLTSGRNVGILTSSPLRNLVVKQSVNSYLGGLAVERSDNLSYLGIFNDGTLWNIAASYNSGGSYQPIGFYTSDVERMRILNDNTVCFGKTVYDNSTTGVSIADTKTTAIVSVVTDAGVSFLANRKTTTGQMFIFRYNGTNVGDISTNGSTITFSGNALSDNRYKDNIEKITNAVDAINKVDWVTFKYKDNQRDSAGVTAQQLQTVPELLKFVIDGIDEDSYKAVDYNAIIGYLGAAIKEQNQLITSLQDRLDKLENK
jgi:hypothetical protein